MCKSFKIFLIAAFFSLSCVPETPGIQDRGECFIAQFENLSSDCRFQWRAGDQISINGYVYRTDEEGNEAKFYPVGDPVPESSEYMAVYPAGLDTYASGVKGTLDQICSFDENGTMPREMLASIARSSVRDLVFKNIYSFFTVSLQTEGLCRASVTSNAGETLAGNYTVDCSGNEPMIFVPKGKNSVSVVRDDGKSFPKGTKLCFAVLPQTLKSGFTFSAHFESGASRYWSVDVPQRRVLSSGCNTDLGTFNYNTESGIGGLGISGSIMVTLDSSNCLDTPVSELIFGSFSEMHGGDLVPGICEQYIVNPSFERWYNYGDKGESKNELVYVDDDAVEKDPSVAYPWEKRVSGSNASFSITEEERYNTIQSQKIVVGAGASAVLLQRLALPFYRTDSYRVKFHARVTGDVNVKVSFQGVGSQEAKTLSKNIFSPTMHKDRWAEYEHEFTLLSSPSYFNNRHSQYNLWIEISGDGTAYIDNVTLFPSDCIDGIFNPETIEYFKDYSIRSIRWPGGNYTSGYNWKNGIGPWKDRPSLKNKAWGGIDSNYLGTDELMRFCELTGAEPVIGVGYNKSLISEQDIADWVEYCNGPSTSEYGAKRAANGHPEPYNVKYWGIGNEVYGSYQLGNVGVAAYSQGLSSVSSRIKTIDDVVILASGRGVHNEYRGAYPGWTESLASSSAYDILDCHLYVYGYDTKSQIGLSAEEYYRIFAAANLNLRDFINQMRTNVPDKKLAFLEWGVLPKLSGKNNPTPQRQTFVNLLLSACQYHEMIRNSDVVHMAAMHNFSFYVSPQSLHSEPVNVRTVLFKELAPLAGGYNVRVDESVFPTYSQTRDMVDVGVREKVPEIDMVAVKKDEYIYVSCVNRSTTEEYNVNFDVPGRGVKGISGTCYTSMRPYERSLWSNPVAIAAASVTIRDDGSVELPPMSYSLFKLSLLK